MVAPRLVQELRLSAGVCRGRLVSFRGHSCELRLQAFWGFRSFRNGCSERATLCGSGCGQLSLQLETTLCRMFASWTAGSAFQTASFPFAKRPLRAGRALRAGPTAQSSSSSAASFLSSVALSNRRARLNLAGDVSGAAAFFSASACPSSGAGLRSGCAWPSFPPSATFQDLVFVSSVTVFNAAAGSAFSCRARESGVLCDSLVRCQKRTSRDVFAMPSLDQGCRVRRRCTRVHPSSSAHEVIRYVATPATKSQVGCGKHRPQHTPAQIKKEGLSQKDTDGSPEAWYALAIHPTLLVSVSVSVCLPHPSAVVFVVVFVC